MEACQAHSLRRARRGRIGGDGRAPTRQGDADVVRGDGRRQPTVGRHPVASARSACCHDLESGGRLEVRQALHGWAVQAGDVGHDENQPVPLQRPRDVPPLLLLFVQRGTPLRVEHGRVDGGAQVADGGVVTVNGVLLAVAGREAVLVVLLAWAEGRVGGRRAVDHRHRVCEARDQSAEQLCGPAAVLGAGFVREARRVLLGCEERRAPCEVVEIAGNDDDRRAVAEVRPVVRFEVRVVGQGAAGGVQVPAAPVTRARRDGHR
mmetsp:Transcript_7552/g.23561  ORF Transcript_7552/g.23561 Transcript_7552/m.23561 type:complete len:263 (-) Transcript_7552:227-1015(-)